MTTSPKKYSPGKSSSKQVTKNIFRLDDYLVNNVFSAKKNQIKMMQRRGYRIEGMDKEIMSMSGTEKYLEYAKKVQAEGKKDFITSLGTEYYKYNDDGSVTDVAYVYYLGTEPFDKKVVTSITDPVVSFVRTTRIKTWDIITGGELINAAKRKFFDLAERRFNFWNLRDFSYDMYDNIHVPMYRVLSDSEIKNLFYDENGTPLIHKRQLPHLRKDDPVAKYLDLEPGSIVEHTRVNLYVPSLVNKCIKYSQVTDESIMVTLNDVDTSDDKDFFVP